jgi:hypothetical protein
MTKFPARRFIIEDDDVDFDVDDLLEKKNYAGSAALSLRGSGKGFGPHGGQSDGPPGRWDQHEAQGKGDPPG